MRFFKGKLIAMLLLVAFTFKESKKIEVIKIKTNLGDILVYLYDQTPQHQANFLKLAENGFFNGTTFHRVIPGFMIQGGDPDSKDTTKKMLGSGGPGYTIPAEFNANIIHKYGALAGAREGDQVNPKKESSGSQFYIVTGKKYSNADMDNMEKRTGKKWNEDQRKIYAQVGGTPFLDWGYTVFGEVITGMDVVEKIAQQPRDANDRPLKNVTMTMEVIKTTPSELVKKYHFSPQVDMGDK